MGERTPAVRGEGGLNVFAGFSVLSRAVLGLRHPVYAARCLLVAAKLWQTYLALAAFFPVMMRRLKAKEQVMASSSGCIVYRDRVRWRPLPGMW